MSKDGQHSEVYASCEPSIRETNDMATRVHISIAQDHFDEIYDSLCFLRLGLSIEYSEWTRKSPLIVLNSSC